MKYTIFPMLAMCFAVIALTYVNAGTDKTLENCMAGFGGKLNVRAAVFSLAFAASVFANSEVAFADAKSIFKYRSFSLLDQSASPVRIAATPAIITNKRLDHEESESAESRDSFISKWFPIITIATIATTIIATIFIAIGMLPRTDRGEIDR